MKQNYYRLVPKQSFIKMLPQIKSKSQQILPHHFLPLTPKHKQWNDRFMLESMPEYSPIKDPHIKKYRKAPIQHNLSQPESSPTAHRQSIVQYKSSIVSQRSLSSLPPQNIRQISSKQPARPVQDKVHLLVRYLQQKCPECNNQQFIQFHKILLSHAIPSLFIYFLLKSYVVKNMRKLEGFDAKEEIHKQIRDVKNKDGFYYKIMGCWQARSRFLETFEKFIKDKVQNEQQVNQAKQKLKQHIKQLRLLTANLIQIVSKWRQSLNIQQIEKYTMVQCDQWMIAPERPIFYIEAEKHKQNVLLRILNDNKFILSSAIASCVAMGTKNDPFLLSPLIKASNGEPSDTLQIFELTKEQSVKYKTIMEYLANQKAYDLKKRQRKQNKRSLNKIEKIYVQNHRSNIEKSQQLLNGSKNEGSQKQKEEAKKLKIQRINKNKQRMEMIKAVYDRSGKRSRINSHSQDNEIEEIGQLAMPIKQKGGNRTQLDQQFDRLVEERYEMMKIPLEKQPSPAKRKKFQNSPTSQTEEDKIIKKLKNLDQELRQKLHQINKQTNNREGLPSNKYLGKNNKEIVQELKKQIITKIEAEEQEKQTNKKKRKQEEQRILNEIKQKMKKDIADKIALKKQQKLQEKQRLEKQLQEEQNRIKQQRQIQIQMLVRISKEKEMRNMEKIKREAVEKQNILKEQLAREQLLRKEKQEAIAQERMEKQKLIRELQAKQLKHQLKQQIREVYAQDNKNRAELNEQSNNKSEHQLIKQVAMKQITTGEPAISQINQLGQATRQKTVEEIKLLKQLELRKQMQLLKQKQERQIDLIEKQNELRAKMLKFKKNQQQIIDKDIDLLRRRNIQLQQQVQTQSPVKERVAISSEEEIKKIEALQKMRQEKEAEEARQIEFNKIRKQRQIQESTLRQKIKQKIEKQLRSEAVKRTKREMQEREQKEYERKKEEGQYRHKIFTQNPINRQVIIDEEKQKILESQFLFRQVKQENAKASLRSQFEQELLASSLPSKFYIDKDYLKVKNTGQYLGDDYLHQKMQGTKEAVVKYKELDHSPLKKSHIKEHIYDLTDQQLYIYKKQKNKNMENLEEIKEYLPQSKEQQKEYQKMDLNQEKQPEVIKANKKHEPIDSQDQKKKVNRKNRDNQIQKKQKKIIVKHFSENKKQEVAKNSTDSEKEYNRKQNNRKVKQNQKQKPSKQRKNINLSGEKNRNSAKEKQIRAAQIQERSESSDAKEQKLSKANQNAGELDSANSVVYRKIPEQQLASKFKFGLQFQAIPQSELDHNLEIHFSRLPVEQAAILSIKRNELYRKLVNELTFSIIVGSFENRMIGTAYIHHDRFASSTLASPEARKFKIAHIATYESTQLKPFILQVCNFIFLKDPCDQIEFIYNFDQNEEEQFRLSSDLTKWFNEHGSIYQKKLDENVYERKFVYKRQYHHKCQIDLIRVNKSTFKNVVHINCGILVVLNQMHELKQHFYSQPDLIPLQNKTLYTLLVSELFRTYLNPEQAEKLKKQLKNPVYKQMLSIIMALQKKKMKIDQYRLSEYKSLMELNMKMMSQGKQTIKFLQDKGQGARAKREGGDEEMGNQIFYGQISWRGGVMFNFQVAVLPISQTQPEDQRKSKFAKSNMKNINYFRLNPLPSYKLHLIKSSLYNTEMYMLPTESQKLKIFILPAEQYLQIKQKQLSEPPPTPLTLHTYLRIYMKNISKYIEDTQYKYIWVPEISTERNIAKIDDFKGFYQRDIYMHDTLNMSYRQFIPSGLIIQPQHRDLVVTAPFVIGLMSMSVEQVIEGCPLYGRLVESSEVKVMELQ